MKKSLMIAMTVLTMAVMMVGCGKKSADGNSSAEPSVTEAPTPTPTPCEMLDLPEKAKDADTAKVLTQYEEAKDDILAKEQEICEIYEIPCMYIVTEDETKIKDKDVFVPSVVDMFNCDEQYAFSATAGIKLRGNSTSGGNQPPLRIKFEEPRNLIGLHDGAEFKNWVCLKSNWNLCMDYMAFNLAKNILGEDTYSSDCEYVQIYINGKYKGLYLLCEQNQACEGRVEIKEADKKAEWAEAPDSIGYFLEIDNNASEEHPYFTLDYHGITIPDYSNKIKTMGEDNISIKSDIYSVPQYDFISKYTANVFDIMYEACVNDTPMMFDENYDLVSAEGTYTPQEAVEAVIDVDSFINMTILYELVQDYDVGAGSFYFAVDFSEDATYSKFSCTAPWDFNWGYTENPKKNFYACCWVEPTDDWDRSNIWLIVPMLADWYQEKMFARWTELSNSGIILETTKDVQNHLEILRHDLEHDEEPWKIDSGKEVVNYVETRVEFLDDNWKK